MDPEDLLLVWASTSPPPFLLTPSSLKDSHVRGQQKRLCFPSRENSAKIDLSAPGYRSKSQENALRLGSLRSSPVASSCVPHQDLQSDHEPPNARRHFCFPLQSARYSSGRIQHVFRFRLPRHKSKASRVKGQVGHGSWLPLSAAPRPQSPMGMGRPRYCLVNKTELSVYWLAFMIMTDIQQHAFTCLMNQPSLPPPLTTPKSSISLTIMAMVCPASASSLKAISRYPQANVLAPNHITWHHIKNENQVRYQHLNSPHGGQPVPSPILPL